MELLSIEEAGKRFRDRSLSPVELTRECLRRIDILNPELRAFITVLSESALDQAKQAERELYEKGVDRGALHGIPIGIKDIIDVAGVRTTAGSRLYQEADPAEADAVVVHDLKAAGAIIIGKTSTHEFAIGGASDTEPYPTGRNPWNTDRITGGSSSGNGVAVPTGMCLGAIGSDTGGSVRMPAGYCCLTGLKPTYGSTSLAGVVPLCASLDSLGPMTRTAVDAALMFRVMSGRALNDFDPGLSLKNLKIGVERGLFKHKSTFIEIDQTIDRVAETFRAAGVELIDLVLTNQETNEPISADDIRTPWSALMAEAYEFHQATIEASPDSYAGSKERIMEGKSASAVDYVRATRFRQHLADAFAALFLRCQVILAPASPIMPPTFSAGPEAFPPPRAAFTLSSNMAGLAAIVAPAGFSSDGMPIGYQLVGPPGSESLLLSVAAAYQQLTDWHLTVPPVLEANSV